MCTTANLKAKTNFHAPRSTLTKRTCALRTKGNRMLGNLASRTRLWAPGNRTIGCARPHSLPQSQPVHLTRHGCVRYRGLPVHERGLDPPALAAGWGEPCTGPMRCRRWMRGDSWLRRTRLHLVGQARLPRYQAGRPSGSPCCDTRWQRLGACVAAG